MGAIRNALQEFGATHPQITQYFRALGRWLKVPFTKAKEAADWIKWVLDVFENLNLSEITLEQTDIPPLDAKWTPPPRWMLPLRYGELHEVTVPLPIPPVEPPPTALPPAQPPWDQFPEVALPLWEPLPPALPPPTAQPPPTPPTPPPTPPGGGEGGGTGGGGTGGGGGKTPTPPTPPTPPPTPPTPPTPPPTPPTPPTPPPTPPTPPPGKGKGGKDGKPEEGGPTQREITSYGPEIATRRYNQRKQLATALGNSTGLERLKNLLATVQKPKLIRTDKVPSGATYNYKKAKMEFRANHIRTFARYVAEAEQQSDMRKGTVPELEEIVKQIEGYLEDMDIELGRMETALTGQPGYDPTLGIDGVRNWLSYNAGRDDVKGLLKSVGLDITTIRFISTEC